MSEKKPGKYKFKVATATPKQFQSGNRGIALKLTCDGQGETNQWLFANLMDLPSCERRNAAFYTACGAQPGNPLVGLSGYVECEVNDKGYLEAAKWLPRDTREVAPAPAAKRGGTAEQQDPWHGMEPPF